MSTSTLYPAISTKLSLTSADFITLRQFGMVYVDKTDLVLNIASKFRKAFLSRPRRFGKTLLISTFESLFRDGLKYFGSAACSAEPPLKIAGQWNEPTYLVVRLDFSFMKADGELTKASLEDDFRDEVVAAFEEVGFQLASDSRPWISQLKTWLIRQCPRYSIVLLIDEYDAGLGSRLNDETSFSRALSILSAFFAMVKSTDQAWRFVFITGVARFGEASLLSSMNDFVDLTFMSDFGTLLGYTERELRDNFFPYLERAAIINNTNVDSLIADMSQHYGGFCFDASASTHVHAPWSVLQFLSAPRDGFASYWAGSSGNASALVEWMKSGGTNLKALMSEVTVPLARMKSGVTMKALQEELLLNQAGYLSIVGVKGNRVVLGAPNLEVASTLADACLSKLLPENTGMGKGLPDIYDALQTGAPDVWSNTLNAYMSVIPHQQYPIDSEAAAREFALAFCLGRGIRCAGERINAWGRSDLEVRMPNVYWVMEFKFVGKEEPNQDAAVEQALNQALTQIRQRRYGAHVAKLPLVRVALVFSEAERQIARWGQLPEE